MLKKLVAIKNVGTFRNCGKSGETVGDEIRFSSPSEEVFTQRPAIWPDNDMHYFCCSFATVPCKGSQPCDGQ